ncbi:hypothetical protein GCM10007858_58820 [Bradyrhizobium liaoningense]|nr:hypothetical protein GCM10007858_58820 [Bradyrhizobium liaoningense]
MGTKASIQSKGVFRISLSRVRMSTALSIDALVERSDVFAKRVLIWLNERRERRAAVRPGGHRA